ncbi:hypothetical protein [uncultured Roseobacter sp.]|nr:hypothetical protein [uncultured Roseobacter sp.]
MLHREDVPQYLLRECLALRAAQVCVRHQGRIGRAPELRDVAGLP